MYKITRLIHIVDPLDRAAVSAVIHSIQAAVTSMPTRTALVSATLPGVRNGGDVLVHLQFDNAQAWQSVRTRLDAVTVGPLIDHVDGVEYSGRGHQNNRSGRRDSTRTPRVYRSLLLRVDDSASERAVERFEAATLRMPLHIRQIRAWQLSRVTNAVGGTQWTHVWEQEFEQIEDLLGPYMYHPIHWAHVDPFFDPESTDYIIKHRVCHSFCESPAPLIGAAPASLSTFQES